MSMLFSVHNIDSGVFRVFRIGAQGFFHPWRLLAASWALFAIPPDKARHYARTLIEGVGECWTHSCVCVLLTVTADKPCVV